MSALSAVWLVLVAGQEPTPAPEPREEFARVAAELYGGDSAPFGAEPARSLAAALEDPATKSGQKAGLRADLGHEWVEMGRLEEAITLLEQGLREVEAEGRAKPANRLRRELALAYLRLAETRNCVENHAAGCCTLPLTGNAVHRLREPAARARALYRATLALAPEDLGVRWLLNLLARLLGEDPEALPEGERLALRAFAEGDDEPQFRDVGARAGLDALTLAGGCAAEDFDGDGWIDLLVSDSDPRGALRYYRNRGDGGFEDRSDSSGASAQLGGLNLIAADVDNDGDRDALVLRGAWLLEHGCIRNSLLVNAGDGTFADRTRAAGLAEPAAPTQAALFADLDGDGWLDLYVGNESRAEIDGGADHPSQLFLGGPEGVYREVGAAAGVRNDRYAKGVAAGDYDDDGDLDLYVSNIGKNRLYRNDGRGRFADVASEAGVLEPSGRSFATWFFDQDEDGRLDLWVSAYASSIADLAAEALWRPHGGTPPCLYRNGGAGRFTDVASELGLARPMLVMGANFGDVDNDGWLDLYLGTGDPLLESLMPNLCLRNAGGVRFVDVTGRSGLGHLQKGHGIAFADFDHDGDQDVFHELGGFVPVDRYQNALFENRGAGGHWLSLELVGTRTNRDGIGARLTLTLETPDGPRSLHRAAGSVSSFGGSTHRQEIGLGNATRVTRLEIRWPRSEAPQVFTDLPLDAFLRITEGADSPERLERGRFSF